MLRRSFITPKRHVVARIELDISCYSKITARPETVEEFQWIQNLVDMIRLAMKERPDEIKIFVEEIK